MSNSTLSALALASLGLISACERGPSEEALESIADTVTAVPAISLSDIEGTWTMEYEPVSEGTSLTASQVRVTAEGWTLLLPNRDPIPAEVTASGDSLIVVEGPFESIERPGTAMTLHGVYRLDGDRLVGVVAARYETGGDDMVVMLSEGTREP